MKKPYVAIAGVTIYLIIFQLLIQTGADIRLIFVMWSVSPVMILYMVFVILKYGEPSKYDFGERFYDDVDYVRNGDETMKNQLL
ncbi:MAG: hypothetical protein ABI472_06250 [Ginsengibacter sp.]